MVSFLFLSTIVLISCSKNDTTTKLENGNTQSTSFSTNTSTVEEPFETFQLKKHYTSREDVLKEIENLNSIYYNFTTENKTDADLKERAEKYAKLTETLNNLLYTYPPSEEDILNEKERMLDEQIGFRYEDYFYYKNGIDEQNLSESEKIFKQELYNKYLTDLNVQNDYKSGKITIDEALDTLKIEPSSTLENYYLQIEVAKSNNQ